jgi:Putative Ig domain
VSLVITPLGLPGAIIGTPYNQALTVTGGTGPYVWSIATPAAALPAYGGLPLTLTINASTGAITGTTTVAGVYNFTVQVTDSSNPPLLGTQFFTIVSGNTTIANIAAWVTGDYLNRTDMTTQAQTAALDVYRMVCAKVPFEQLYNVTSEIPFVGGASATTSESTYDLSQLVPPLVGIVDIRVTINSNTKRRLRRSSARMYDSLSIIQPGLPSTYARSSAQRITVNPPPNSSAMTFRVRYWARPPEDPTSPTSATVLATPVEWNPLFKWETAWWVLNMLGQEQRASALVQPMMMPRQQSPVRQPMMEIGILPRLWNELLQTISERENVDEDFNINPVIRAYSYRGR